MTRVPGALILFALLAACGQEAESPRPDPIVVYAPGIAGSELASVLENLPEESGIRVSIKWGSSTELTDAAINKTGIPADVLLTDNAYDIWRAADRGALRPLTSPTLEQLPGWLQDPDGYWMATETSYPVVVARDAIEDQERDVGVAADLSSLDGRLCIASFVNNVNQSFVAMQIHDHGVRNAEREIRRWLRAIDRQPYETEAEVVQAVRTGQCDYGLVSSGTDRGQLRAVIEYSEYPVIWAVGVGRHAKYPESAQAFVEWLATTQTAQGDDADKRHAGIAGYRAEEARQLAERVGWN